MTDTATSIDTGASGDFYQEMARLKNKFDSMQPELEMTFTDPDIGVEGFVVVWNTQISKGGPLFVNGKGCGKGGTRIQKDLSLEDVKRLARAMAEKNAAAGLPMGGAKSGLNADPNEPGYEVKWKRFVRLIKDAGILREDGGIFGGFGYDIGGKPPLNALWTIEELGSGKSFTGKPVDLGGTDYDRIGIAGFGVAVAGRTLLEELGMQPEGATYAVQGLGAMGGAVMRYFHDFGGQLKAISDPKFGGTWFFEEGASDNFINAPTLEHLEKEAVKIADSNDGALYQDVDIIFPCALEDAVREDNADKIKARFMVEGANNPTTDAAHQILFKKGIQVVPDILANAGGIIAAYVEMTSDAENKAEEAIELTRIRVATNVRDMMALVKQTSVSPDQVADYMTYKNILKEDAA